MNIKKSTFEIEEITACLLMGGIVLFPTDTVYGLAVSPDFPESVERLYQIKNRTRNVFFPIMIHHDSELNKMGVNITSAARILLNSSLIPGPLTLVLGFVTNPVLLWQSGREEIGIRIPNHVQLLNVLEKTGPLLVSSANRHKAEVPETVKEILPQLAGEIDLVIDTGPLKTIPSTVINCRHNPPHIEREGIVGKNTIKELIGDCV